MLISACQQYRNKNTQRTTWRQFWSFCSLCFLYPALLLEIRVTTSYWSLPSCWNWSKNRNNQWVRRPLFSPCQRYVLFKVRLFLLRMTNHSIWMRNWCLIVGEIYFECWEKKKETTYNNVQFQEIYLHKNSPSKITCTPISSKTETPIHRNCILLFFKEQLKRNLTAYEERIEQLEEKVKGQGHQQDNNKGRNQGQ